MAALLLLSTICARANSGDALDHLRHLSNEQLCEMGKQAAYELQKTDSALIYFETLTSRYRDDMSRDIDKAVSLGLSRDYINQALNE